MSGIFFFIGIVMIVALSTWVASEAIAYESTSTSESCNDKACENTITTCIDSQPCVHRAWNSTDSNNLATENDDFN